MEVQVAENRPPGAVEDGHEEQNIYLFAAKPTITEVLDHGSVAVDEVNSKDGE